MGILQEILKTLSLPEFYFAMFRSATPVLLTTLGAMISSRSGTSNIALEGTMLISAFVGVVVSAFSQSAWVGFLGAVLVLKNCLDDGRSIAEVLAERTRSEVVQVIGKKIVLYKPAKDEAKRKIVLP